MFIVPPPKIRKYVIAVKHIICKKFSIITSVKIINYKCKKDAHNERLVFTSIYFFERLSINSCQSLSIACDVKEAVNDLISENDLNTLILDLGENALIAVQKSEIRNVLIVFGSENESFTVSIYDSGLPFEQQVIENLGKRRITTHRKTCGSGIGLMTTAQLLKKHKASLMIDESIDNESYVKKVSVIFDGLNQLRVITQTNKITRSL